MLMKIVRSRITLVLLWSSALVGVIGGIVAWVIWDQTYSEDVVCLTRSMDREFPYWGHAKQDEDRVVAERQAEALARILIANARKLDQRLCPKTQTRELASRTRHYVFGSDDESARWKFLYPIASRALRGRYIHEWPKEWSCARAYRATALRVPPWILGDTSLKYKGAIGTFSVYC